MSSGRNIVVQCSDIFEFAACVIHPGEIASIVGGPAIPRLIDRGGQCDPDAKGDKNPDAIPFPAWDGLGSIRASSLPQLADQCMSANAASCIAPSSNRPLSATAYCITFAQDETMIIASFFATFLHKKLLVVSRDADRRDLLEKQMACAASAVLVLSNDIRQEFSWDRFCASDTQPTPWQSLFRSLPRGWGVLTASSLSLLSDLLLRICLRSPSPASTATMLYAGEAMLVAPAAGVDAVALPQHPSQAVEQLASVASPLSVFVGHGRSYCALAGNLCSVSTRQPSASTRCAGAYDCVFPDFARTPARHLLSDVVFVDSCSTLNFVGPGPEADKSGNLAMHLVEGHSVAVVSAYRTNTPSSTTPTILYLLLLSGYLLGSAVRKLNYIHQRRFGAFTPYVLLGDPEMQTYSGAAATIEACASEQTDENVWVLTFAAPTKGSKLYVCNDATLVNAAAHDTLNQIGSNYPEGGILIDVLPPDDGEGSCLIMLVCGIQVYEGSISVIISTRAPLDYSVLSAANEISSNIASDDFWVRQLGEVEEAGVKDGIKELAVHIKEKERELVPSRNQPTISADRFWKSHHFEQAIRGRLEDLNKAVMKGVLERSRVKDIWMYSEYAERAGFRRVRDWTHPQACPYCGHKVTATDYEYGLWPARTRTLTECERCMLISDLTDASLLEIRIPVKVQKGIWNEATLVGVNRSNASRFAHASIRVDSMGFSRKLISVDPEYLFDVVSPMEAFSFKFNIKFDHELPDHLYHAKGFVVANGSVEWALRKVEVRRC